MKNKTAETKNLVGDLKDKAKGHLQESQMRRQRWQIESSKDQRLKLGVLTPE